MSGMTVSALLFLDRPVVVTDGTVPYLHRKRLAAYLTNVIHAHHLAKESALDRLRSLYSFLNTGSNLSILITWPVRR